VIIFAAIQIPRHCGHRSLRDIVDLGVAIRHLFRLFFIPFAVPAVVGRVMWSFLLEPSSASRHLANGLGLGAPTNSPSNLIIQTIIVIVIWDGTAQTGDLLPRAEVRARDVIEAAILRRHAAWKDHHEVKLAEVRPAIVLDGVINTIRREQLFTEPLDPAVLRDPGHHGQLHADLLHLQHRDRRRQYNLAAGPP